jgi:hypothetical protein
MGNENRKKTTNPVQKRTGASHSKAQPKVAVATDEVKSGLRTEDSPRVTPGRVRATAGHFVRRSYAWGVARPGKKGDFIQGSVAISRPDLGPTSIYGAIFDPEFQRSVTNFQEQNILRRGGHSFRAERDWSQSSYLVYGTITEDGSSPSFIGVEANTYGAVTVYFREYTKASTIDELVAWWIFGALWMGFSVHALIGTSGPVHAAVLVDLANVSDISVPNERSQVVSMHGPISLEPPESEDPGYDWGVGPALRLIGSVRADLLRQSTGKPWLRAVDEETNWTADKARRSIANGRPADPGTESRGGEHRRGRLGRRIFKRR